MEPLLPLVATILLFALAKAGSTPEINGVSEKVLSYGTAGMASVLVWILWYTLSP